MPVIGRYDEQPGPATAEFPRPDFDAPAPGTGETRNSGRYAAPEQNGPAPADQFARPGGYPPQGGGRDGAQDNGPFIRSDVFGTPSAGPAGAGDRPDQNRFAPQAYEGGSSTGRHSLPGQQDPAATGQFERPDLNGAGQYDRQDASTTGQYDRQDASTTGQYDRPAPAQTGQYDRQDPAATGQYDRQDPAANGRYERPGQPSEDPFGAQGFEPRDPAATGQFDRPDLNGTDLNGTGQYGRAEAAPAAPYDRQDQYDRQDPAATGQFERPAGRGNGFGGTHLQRPQRPVRPEPEALPPAGPGDGRTPLFDTLETNWFRGERQAQAPEQQTPEQQVPEQQTPAAPQPAAPQRPATSSWRSSPNDELVRQAERVRQPAAGGITTSGLPRRVPRANLVPGTAQQQSHQSGPQVSRAPDEVRGRLTNLRRGIAQGRQAGSGQTGNFPRPTHQQER
jgi:hypothetical protein